MICHGCGHEFPNTSARCSRCHRSTSRRGRASTDSRLLEFPRRTRVAPTAEATAPPLPAWRVELNEKVRAIRANRDVSNATIHPPAEEIVKPFESDPRTAGSSALKNEPRSPYARDASVRNAVPPPGSSQPATAPVTGGRRSSNNIVEAALTRVKRASENASRAALPKIEPARSIQTGTQVSRSVDRQATALALDPAPEIESRVEFTPAPRPEVVRPPIIKPARAEATAAPDATLSQASTDDVAAPASVLILDEFEPLDYLEAEVRKVDKALGAEFLRNESPSIFTHAVIGIADLLAVAVSCSPFLAFIRIADGSFSVAHTRLASGAIVVLIAFFYLALTQCLCGRTFGMMLTNTRVVDAQAFEPPSPSQALLRTAGYFVAAAPALVGIIWAAFDRKRRGWQDFISGTVVVRDF
jgi:uncharacterized RDD family membrane protein YckC